MKFFVPKCDTPELALEVWDVVKRRCEDYLKGEINDTKIYSLLYLNEGKRYFVTVGEEHPENGEIVDVIFESDMYLICTRNQGVKTGTPIMVGSVVDIEEFD